MKAFLDHSVDCSYHRGIQRNSENASRTEKRKSGRGRLETPKPANVLVFEKFGKIQKIIQQINQKIQKIKKKSKSGSGGVPVAGAGFRYAGPVKNQK